MLRKLALLHALFLLAPAWLRAEVKAIRLPRGGEVPEVELDAKEVLHVTYGRGAPGNGYCVQSRDLDTTSVRHFRPRENAAPRT